MHLDAGTAAMNSSPIAPAEEPPTTTEADLERLRARLHMSLGALENRLHELRDWRSWLRRHPWPFVLAAFGAGALLGVRRGRSRPDVTGR
jgi:hypothetical protein